MGIEIITLTTDEVIERMPVEGNRQPMLAVHGGANAVLVEDAASRLALLVAPERRAAVGTELTVSHVRAATSGWVTARAIRTYVGRSSMISTVELRDDDGELTALGKLTCVFTKL